MAIYHVVTEPPFESTPVVELATVDDVVGLLRRLRTADRDALVPRRVYIFCGSRLYLSRGEPKRLLLPGDDYVAIDDSTTDMTPDKSGLVYAPQPDTK